MGFNEKLWADTRRNTNGIKLLNQNDVTIMAYTDLVNLLRYTDKPENAYYTKTATIDGATKKTIDGIVLTKISSSNFYHGLEARNTLNASKKYLCSLYVQTDGVPFFMFLNGDTTNSNNVFYVDNKMRRIKFYATGSTTFVCYAQGNSNFKGLVGLEYSNSFFIGGFQAEEIVADPKNGIAWIGDSTIQFDAGASDSNTNMATPKLIGALLSCSIFNRGISGDTTTQMIARWGTSMTPLVVKSKYCVIQGGINDVNQSATEQTIIDNHATMHALAVADGFEEIYHVTITPFAQTGAKETVRNTVNQALKSTYKNILDFDLIVKDKTDSSLLNQNVNWKGDGTHYALAARIALANYVAESKFFSFLEPSAYVKIDD